LFDEKNQRSKISRQGPFKVNMENSKRSCLFHTFHISIVALCLTRLKSLDQYFQKTETNPFKCAQAGLQNVPSCAPEQSNNPLNLTRLSLTTSFAIVKRIVMKTFIVRGICNSASLFNCSKVYILSGKAIF
jgi:hypothetical protein